MAQLPQPSPLDQLAALTDEANQTGPATAPVEDPISPWFSLLAGGTTGIISLVKTISYGALIFSAGLSPFLPAGLGLLFVSNILTRLITALTASFPPIIYNPQSEQVVIVAFMAASIARQVDPDTPPEALLMTIVLGIGLSSLLTGAIQLALGLMQRGDLGRYLPYPIVGGFWAGVSWLMMTGGIKIIADKALDSSNIMDVFLSGLFC
jgi:SulP family sulfate permease